MGDRTVVTMADVARVAGVSQTTVSHVLNKTRRINPETESAVRDAIETTGYSNDGVARSLRTGTTKMIGLAMSAISNTYFGEVVHAIEREATRAGYSLLLVDTHDESQRERAAISELLSRRVDAVILAPSADGKAAIAQLARRHVPTVLIDRIPEGVPIEGMDAVAVENVDPMAQLVEHLLEAGHTRIGMVTERSAIATTRERIAGFRLAFERRGMWLDPHLIKSGDDDEQPADAAVRALLALADKPTALVASNNRMTIGVMETLNRLGQKIPQDLALVAFDDFPWAHLFHPRLTAMAQPIDELGQRAVSLLLSRLAKGNLEPRIIRLQPEFMHRDSCGHTTSQY
jgi:LacI family transcriptional regulator